jgi:predicted membrane channel-forming protein YqfA (hemolysin III family)
MLPSLADFGDLGPGCPWADLIRRYPPNVKWCEAPLCSWIREPANTWSNLAYVLLGVWMILQGHRDAEAGAEGKADGNDRARLAAIFGWAAIAVGVTSFVYHMSTNFFTQVFDFTGMYIFSALPLLINLHRLGVIRRRLPVGAYVAVVVGLTAITPAVRAAGLPIQGIVALLVLGILVTEALLAVRADTRTTPRRFFFVSLALMGLGALASVSDAARLVCDPQSHVLQGHAIWHVLTALALVALWRFYRDVLTTPAPAA